jgi:hypothetical protein
MIVVLLIAAAALVGAGLLAYGGTLLCLLIIRGLGRLLGGRGTVTR